MASGHLAFRNSLLRRTLFQTHLWVGIAIGLYLLVISLSGAALLFRIDLQRAVHSNLLVPGSPEVRVEATAIVAALKERYPEAQIAGVDAPTTARSVYLAYVTETGSFRTVLADPSDGRVLGELPDSSPIRVLQDLHFNLLAGATGERVNGIGALCLMLLALTGGVIWWQGKSRWTRGLGVRWAGNPGRRLWELHGAVGIWSVLLIALWALTALSFTFPRQFRAAVNAISPLTVATRPQSVLAGERASGFPLEQMVDRARREQPGKHVARIVLPSSVTDTVQVLFARERPTPVGMTELTTVHLDRYSGEVLKAPSPSRSFGDWIMQWAGPLHVGGFGGTAVRAIWLLFGLAPATLFVTGFITWWRRVVRPTYQNTTSSEGRTYEPR